MLQLVTGVAITPLIHYNPKQNDLCHETNPLSINFHIASCDFQKALKIQFQCLHVFGSEAVNCINVK